MQSKFLAGLFICLATFSAHAQDDKFLGGHPPGDEPLDVLMGFNLVNITDVSEKEETIDFEGAIYLEWKDPRLQYEPAKYGMRDSWVPGDYSKAPRHIY